MRRHVAVGTAAGLVWSGTLRLWMVLLAGSTSRVSWRTPVLVLLPGGVVGGLLGWASGLRVQGHRPPRLLVLAPSVFAVALLDPKTARSLVTDGQGSGALIVVVTAVSGGHALSRRGWTRRRVATATLAAVGVATLTAMGSMAGPLTSRRGLGTALLGGTLGAMACVAATLPYEQQADAGALVALRGGQGHGR